MDNARIHHAKLVKPIYQRAKIDVTYGIPYTPFLNIIENFFRSFKTQIRNEFLSDRADIKKLIKKCWKNVSSDVLVNTYNNVYVNAGINDHI